VEHNVAQDKEAARAMVERTRQFAVPVLVIDDKDVVVGFNAARLDELLFPAEGKSTGQG
jgi:glutaredoxin